MERILFKNALVYKNEIFQKLNILVEDEKIKDIKEYLDTNSFTILLNNKVIMPGFIDVHVHFREPGFSYKETIKTGSNAALNGGYMHVCTMPNLNPVPDSLEHLKVQLDIIKEKSVISIYPYGSITKGEKGLEVSNMEELAPYVIGFSDDGYGVSNYDVMYEAMERASKLNKLIAGHCEVKSITGNGYINDGVYSKMHNHIGIPNESEYEEVRRNIEISRKTGCHFHVCHASCKETVELVRNAKKGCLNVTCETAPQYLLLSEMDIKDNGCYRFQPPLRKFEDKLALIQGIQDGTIDIIATDHAPHSYEEKNRGLKGSLNGIVGLECAFQVLYTNLVKKGVISLEKLLSLLIDNPKRIFGIDSEIKIGSYASFNIWDLEELTKIDSSKFESMGRSTPFDGQDVYSKKVLTMIRGKKYENKR